MSNLGSFFIPPGGPLGSRPLASAVGIGALYATDDQSPNIIYRSNGTTWDVWATIVTSGSGGGQASGAHMMLLEDQEEPMLIPGPRGEKGDTGAAGPPGSGGGGGSSGAHLMMESEVEEPLVIPGPRGADGASGSPTGSPELCCGRLTLESGVPVSTTDQTGKTSVYFTPYKGNRISLFDGTATWNILTFSELTLALGTLTSGKNYDVFAVASGSTVTLEALAWTDDTTRATALTLQDGVLVKSGATTRRYLGTFRTTSTTTTEDSGGGSTTQVGGKRFLWNYYNQVRRGLALIDTTDNWSYGTAAWRQANGASGNKVEYVCGVNEEAVTATLLVIVNTGSNSRVSIGFDSVTTPSRFVANGTSGHVDNLSVQYTGMAGLGYHYLSWMEYGASGNFFGDNGGTLQSGLSAIVMA